VSTVSLSTKSKRDSSTADIPRVVGRFAPSPTGPLHLGSLLAATASYVDAHARGGVWRLRIDDLDTYRNDSAAEAQILSALDAHGLHWDGAVQHQSAHTTAYHDALSALSDQTFYCNCSRRSLRELSVYPGTCRAHREPRAGCAVRIAVDDAEIAFTDLIMGQQVCRLGEQVGDFIIRRRDGLIAYQLATAVDDGSGDITHVVRGSDLLDITARQIFLMQRLNLQPPAYAHVPTLVYPSGQKLSKQHGAKPIESAQAGDNLILVLGALGLEVTGELIGAPVEQLLSWAVAHWELSKVSGQNYVLPT
jgi:glutamyl-Q tRNA(Asp) synthetase